MNLEEKKQEIRTKLDKTVLPKVKELIERRGKAQEKLERLQKALLEHEEKLEKLNLNLKDLIDAVAEALGEDRDPAPEKTRVRKTQDEVTEIKGTILSLKEKFIPEAKTAIKSAEQALKDAVRSVVGAVRDEYENIMAKLIDDAMEWWECWDQTTEGFYKEYNFGLIADVLDEVPRFHKKSERLNLYVRNVIGFAG